jgi:endonuclease IV
MAILSFNVSVAGDKTFLSKYDHPMQIMPQQRKTITSSMLEQYPEIKEKRLACVHTSYITRVFGEKMLSPGFQQMNIINYLALANRIGFQYILVHGPESMKEWQLLDGALNVLNELVKKSNGPAKVIIEMPAFKGTFINDLKNEMINDTSYKTSDIKDITVQNYISYYFDRIIGYGFDIVLDTAHLWANGCNTDDMIYLYKHYAKNMKITHLNGNKRGQFTSDAHCPIFLETNKIDRIDDLMKYLSTTSLVLITENASDGVEYVQWKRFADKYGLKIIPDHPNLNC